MPTERSPTRASTGSMAENMNPMAEQPTGTHINKVAVRAPPFWENEPELWFAQLEGQFLLAGVTQDATKYAHVLSQIDTRYAREVKDVITDPPATDKYLAIKTALIRRLSASQEHRIRQLLEHEEMGDRKPFQFLRNLRTLAGNAVPEQLLRTLWLGRLPTTIQAILATRVQDRLEDVAEQADRIQEVTVRSVNEVKTAPDDPSPMAHQIRQLTNQVAAMARRLEQTPHPRNRNRSKSREKKKRDHLCFYHGKFGQHARKCTQPCNFQSGNERGSH
ncbi:uncharacterized protein LOC116847131 [Odontomachus brunneus]|uniref:uncharacterized protein LOC116847131 n=1 Tax=Odontomachus brunneus TaxID=486640 RepID=UPI0013F288FE|nr:uncharacterized protein LOC116847131 [Odontomachus brunneus]